MRIVIGFTTSFFAFILIFFKAEKLSKFLTTLSKIDDEFHDLCESIHVDYRKSLFFQLKCLVVGILLFSLIGIFDYFVFQG